MLGGKSTTSNRGCLSCVVTCLKLISLISFEIMGSKYIVLGNNLFGVEPLNEISLASL